MNFNFTILPSSDKEHGMENTLFIDGFSHLHIHVRGDSRVSHVIFSEGLIRFSWYVKLDVS